MYLRSAKRWEGWPAVDNSSSLPRLLDERPSRSCAFTAQQPVSLSFELVIVDKEDFQLPEKMARKVFEPFDIGVGMVRIGNGHQTVIANAFFPVELLAFDDANQPRQQQTAGKGRLIHQNQNIDRIAIARNRVGKKSEVVRKGHAGRQHFLQRKDLLVNIEGILITAALGSLDDNLKKTILICAGS